MVSAIGGLQSSAILMNPSGFMGLTPAAYAQATALPGVPTLGSPYAAAVATPSYAAGGTPTQPAGTVPVQPQTQSQEGMALQLMQGMLQLIAMLLGMMNGGNGQAQGQPLGAGTAAPAPAGGAGATNAVASYSRDGYGSGNPSASFDLRAGAVNGQTIIDPDAGDQAQLQRSLDLIAQDPEGQKLLQEAKNRGVTIEAGDPGGPGVNGVTFSQGDKSHIIVKDPTNIKTLVHELVHAVSTEDGNSQHEEGLANVIGERVAARATGQGQGVDVNTIYQRTLPLYTELQRVNGIEQSLGRLGVIA